MSRLEGRAWLESPEKRHMDIGICLGTLVPAGFIKALSGALIYSFDHVDPIYRSERYGHPDEPPIIMLKNRTMPYETENRHSTGPGDERASKVGSFLRKMWLDEGPQWLNVWNDEMSWVGPRPLAQDTLMRMRDELDAKEWRDFAATGVVNNYYDRTIESRSIAKGGVFDPYSVSAYRTVNTLNLTEMALATTEYCNTANRLGDWKIIGATVELAATSAAAQISEVTTNSLSRLAKVF